MTENEAIKEIQRICCNESQYYQKGGSKCKDICIYGKNFCAFQTAIEALEEVQEYRKIGTVEKFREAMKKMNPIKPEALDNDFDYYKCPVCGEYIWATDTINDHKYCLNCGQAIDWEESEEE